LLPLLFENPSPSYRYRKTIIESPFQANPYFLRLINIKCAILCHLRQYTYIITARSIKMFKKVMVTALVLGVSSLANAGENTRQISESSEVFVGVELGATFLQGDTGDPVFGELNHEGS
jgi:hypothetical protein